MPAPTLWLTALAMLAFAGNSLLCRLALSVHQLDAATFTAVRILSGALVLWLILRSQQPRTTSAQGHWFSGLMLFVYAGAFSYGYLSVDTGTGALILFGAVQLTMVLTGLWRGERLGPGQILGLLLALGGLVWLLLPGSSAPALEGALLMLASGVAWGAYSLSARRDAGPLAATSGNFLLAIPLAVGLLLIDGRHEQWNLPGLGYAVASGALASGLGYAIWYKALQHLNALQAASVQLSVPILAAGFGILLLGEPLQMRLVLTGLAVLGGIALILRSRTGR